MSVTTTANPITTNTLRILADYEVHHSGENIENVTVEDPNPRSREAEAHVDNPDWWDRSHRRVPQHRPVNRNLDREERPDGVNPIERTFIFTMLNGVGLVAVRSSTAHFTLSETDIFCRKLRACGGAALVISKT